MADEGLQTILANGVLFVRKDSRDDYRRAIRAEALLETAREALQTISDMPDSTEGSSFREEAWAALEAIGVEAIGDDRQ